MLTHSQPEFTALRIPIVNRFLSLYLSISYRPCAIEPSACPSGVGHPEPVVRSSLQCEPGPTMKSCRATTPTNRASRTSLPMRRRTCTAAFATMAADWDRYCISYVGYSPDLDERRANVRNRDGRACSACGWPNGFRVPSRNLHVHHAKPLGSCGDNSFTNLVTICHVCHRKQDGPGHARIRYKRDRNGRR